MKLNNTGYTTIQQENILTDEELNTIRNSGFTIVGFTYNPSTNEYVYIFNSMVTEEMFKGKQYEVPFNVSTTAPTRFMFKNALIKLGVHPQTANDWIKVRQAKKAAQTETAFNIAAKEIKAVCEIYDVTPTDVIRVAIDRNWQGLKRSWYDNVEWSDYGVQVGTHDLPFGGGNNQNWE